MIILVCIILTSCLWAAERRYNQRVNVIVGEIALPGGIRMDLLMLLPPCLIALNSSSSERADISAMSGGCAAARSEPAG